MGKLGIFLTVLGAMLLYYQLQWDEAIVDLSITVDADIETVWTHWKHVSHFKRFHPFV